MNPQEQAVQTAQPIETAPPQSNTTIINGGAVADKMKAVPSVLQEFLLGTKQTQQEGAVANGTAPNQTIGVPAAEAGAAPAFAYDTSPNAGGTVGTPVSTAEATSPTAAGDQPTAASAPLQVEPAGLQPAAPEGTQWNQPAVSSASPDQANPAPAAVAGNEAPAVADATNPYGTTAANEANPYAAGATETTNPYAPTEQPAAPMAQQTEVPAQATTPSEAPSGVLSNPYADSKVTTGAQSEPVLATRLAGNETGTPKVSPAQPETVTNAVPPLDTAMPNASEAPVSIAVPTDTVSDMTPPAAPVQEAAMMNGVSPAEQTIAQAATDTAAVTTQPPAAENPYSLSETAAAVAEDTKNIVGVSTSEKSQNPALQEALNKYKELLPKVPGWMEANQSKLVDFSIRQMLKELDQAA